MSYLDLTIAEIHQAILDGKVTPLQLVEESLKRAKNDTCNSFEYICEKEALERVKNLDESLKNNFLYGIPFVLKDNISTKDIPTCGSSNSLEGYIPVFSAEVCLKLENQGAILIGKTTLDELAMGGSGTTGHKGKTFNPWDKKHTRHIGGSSCGSASACASGIVPLAIGSDTGDSARKPAAYSGLVGFKPTWGRVSRFGVFPFACSLDAVGYFTRSVYDSAKVLEAIAGHDEKDLTSSLKEVENYSNVTSDLKGKKFAIIDEIYNSITDQKVKGEFEKTLASIQSKGGIINHYHLDINICKAIYPTYIVISCSESTSNNACIDGVKFGKRESGNSYEEIVLNSRSKGFSKPIQRRFIIGSYSLLKENQKDTYIKAQKCRRLISNKINEILSENDAIYMPSAPSIAPLFESVTNTLSDEYLLADNYLCVANFNGSPSISIPLGFEDGMPFGVNLICKQFDEKNMFSIADSLESIIGLRNLIAK